MFFVWKWHWTNFIPQRKKHTFHYFLPSVSCHLFCQCIKLKKRTKTGANNAVDCSETTDRSWRQKKWLAWTKIRTQVSNFLVDFPCPSSDLISVWTFFSQKVFLDVNCWGINHLLFVLAWVCNNQIESSELLCCLMDVFRACVEMQVQPTQKEATKN